MSSSDITIPPFALILLVAFLAREVEAVGRKEDVRRVKWRRVRIDLNFIE